MIREMSENTIPVCDAESLEKIVRIHSAPGEHSSPVSQNLFPFQAWQGRKNRKEKCLHLIAVIVSAIWLSFCGLRVWQFYEQYYHFDVSEATLQAAIDYNEAGNPKAARRRLNLLVDNGWDGERVYLELAKSYYLEDDTEEAARILNEFISFVDRPANCTPYSKIVALLKEMSALDEGIMVYVRQYDRIENEIQKGDFDKAVYDCETLRTAGADFFEFVCLYVTVLANAGRENEAFHYIMERVDQDVSYRDKSITALERTMLLQYIQTYLSGKKQKACQEKLLNGYGNLALHDGLQYRDSESGEELIERARDFFEQYCEITTPMDTVCIAAEPVLIRSM